MADVPAPQHPPENTDSDLDTEALAARMYEITKTQEQLEEERIEIRKTLTERIDGSRYFIDPLTGQKKYAYVVRPEPIEVDLDKLREKAPPEIVESVLEEPKPREVDKAKFKKAVETGRIPQDVFVAVARTGKGNPHIRFGDPYGPPPVR